jgi:hypothetical protein
VIGSRTAIATIAASAKHHEICFLMPGPPLVLTNYVEINMGALSTYIVTLFFTYTHTLDAVPPFQDRGVPALDSAPTAI